MPAMPIADSSPPIVVGMRHTSSATIAVTDVSASARSFDRGVNQGVDPVRADGEHGEAQLAKLGQIQVMPLLISLGVAVLGGLIGQLLGGILLWAVGFFGLGTVPLMLGYGAVASYLSGRFKKYMAVAAAVVVVVLGIRIFSNAAAIRRHLLKA